MMQTDEPTTNPAYSVTTTGSPQDVTALERLQRIEDEKVALLTRVRDEREVTLATLRAQCAILGKLTRDQLTGIIRRAKSDEVKAKKAPAKASKKATPTSAKTTLAETEASVPTSKDRPRPMSKMA